MSPHRYPPLHIEKDEETTTVTVSTEDLAEANLQTLGEHLFAIVAGLDGGSLEVDMSEVRYLTSTALGKFVGLHKRVREQGGRLVLTNLNDEVYEIFEVTQLHRLLDIRRASGSDDDREHLTPLAS